MAYVASRKLIGRKPKTRVTRDPIWRSSVKGQGHQATQRRDRKSAISSEQQGVAYGILMEYADPHHRRAR